VTPDNVAPPKGRTSSSFVGLLMKICKRIEEDRSKVRVGSLSNGADRFYCEVRRASYVLIAFFSVFCVGLGLALGSSVAQRFSIMLAAAIIALTSVTLGTLLGLIFAIPRALQAPASDANSRYNRYAANTNLEQISDWLTKILVGISLVQIGKLPAALGALGRNVTPMLGSSPVSGGIGVAICVTAIVAAFLLSYLWTRIMLPWFFATIEREIDDITTGKAAKDTIDVAMTVVGTTYQNVLKKKQISDSVISEVAASVADIIEKSSVKVDLREFDSVASLPVPVSDDTTVRDLQVVIYSALPKSVPAYTYGELWVLRRPRDGKLFTDIGTKWAREGGKGHSDNRTLLEVGISPGEKLEAVRLRA